MRYGIFVYDPTNNREGLVGTFSKNDAGTTPESVWEYAECTLSSYKPFVSIYVKRRW